MAAGFRMAATRWLKRRGLSGEIEVSLADDGLRLTGAAGEYRIAPERVARLRAGVDRANKGGPFFEARIWVRGEDSPLHIVVRPPFWGDYLGVIGDLAARLDPALLECGLSSAGRRFLIGLLFLPLAFGLVVAAIPLRAEPLWQKAAVCALPAAVFGIAVRVTRGWSPRPAHDLADFRKALAGS